LGTELKVSFPYEISKSPQQETLHCFYHGLFNMLSRLFVQSRSVASAISVPRQVGRWAVLQSRTYKRPTGSNLSPTGFFASAQSAASAAAANSPPSLPTQKKLGRQRRDEEITARFITLVDETGQVHRDIRLKQALSNLDRQSFFLVEVDPQAEPHPVCRITPKKAIFEKTKAAKRQNIARPEAVLKEVTFGWNVSPHDMGHKLSKAEQFLTKGNKVRIEVVAKKGQQRLPRDAQEAVVEKIVAQLKPFSKAMKNPSFVQGQTCIIVFEGKAIE
jgi:translation initiation factor IF-3